MATSEYQDYGWDPGTTDAHRYLYPTLRWMMEEDKDKTILDFGCGNWILAAMLLDEKATTFMAWTRPQAASPGRGIRSDFLCTTC